MQVIGNRVFLILASLLLGALVSCGSPYQAPVDQAGEPMYLNSGRQHLVNSGETLYVVAWMYNLDFSALARANNLVEPYTLTPGQLLTVDLRSAGAGGSSATLASNSTSIAAQSTGAVEAAQPAVAVAAPLRRSSLPPSPTDNRPSSTALPAAAGAAATAAGTAAQGAAATGTAIANAPTPTPSVPAPAPAARSTAPAATTTAPRATNAAPNWAWPHNGNLLTRFAESTGENKGIDIGGNAGDPVLAAADGEVVYAGSGLLRYGNLIIIKHTERFLSAYAHNRALLVGEKDKVKQGQKIAELGSSGVDRNMLHFEIRLDGKPVDPLGYLPKK
jgi:lipoprotein NlpD